MFAESSHKRAVNQRKSGRSYVSADCVCSCSSLSWQLKITTRALVPPAGCTRRLRPSLAKGSLPMSTANSLPKKLRARLAELGQRLRRQNMVRGLCRIVVVIAMAAVFAVLLDALLSFPRWMRGFMFLGWLALGFFEIRRFIQGPMSQTLDPEGLASAIEQEYPRLGERLTTAVELAGSTDPANGSPELIDMVIQDAATRTRKLDLTRAAPARTTAGFAIAGVAALLAVLVPLVTVPRASEHARRFFLPWYAPSVESPYKIVVTSGNPNVKRGETTALTALIEITKPNAPPPQEVFAVIRTARGTDRVPMNYDKERHEAFLTRGPLEADFDYQIVCGEAESEWHRVTVIDPVRLDSARLIVQPPAYALKAGEKQLTVDGLAELTVLQYSKITYDLRFTRMPSAAWLEWKPENEDAGRLASPSRKELTVAADFSTRMTVTAIANGEYRLLIESDKVKTPPLAQTLRVIVDAAPRFEKVSGVVSAPRAIKPGEKLPIDCVVMDDVAISMLSLEYRINKEDVQVIPLDVKGLGTQRSVGVLDLDLKAKTKEGDVIQYRLAAIDNRDIPEANLKPQKSYFPVNERWAELRIDAKAAPLKDQEILAKKDEIDRRLKDLVQALKAEQHAAYRLKVETANKATLKDEQRDSLDELTRNVLETGEAINDLARDIGLTPELSDLANAVRDIGENEVRNADTALNQARRDEKADPRTKNLDKADNSLVEAIRKLDALRQENERLAKERLDKARLDRLAEEQKNLADETAKADKDKLEELQKKQKELEEQLKKLQEDSDPIRKALEELQRQRAEQLANESKRLAQQLRDLTRDMQANEQNAREQRVADLLKKQDELSRKARELADKTDVASRTAPLSPLKKDEIEKANDALKNGNLNDAVVQQERAALELLRLAKELEQAVARARDPREAARQLERLQEDLRQKMAETSRTTPFDQLPKDRREAFEKQEQAIASAAQKLSVPPDAADAEKTRKSAVEHAKQAAASLKESDANYADAQMQKARESLARLAEQLPSQEKRLAQARAEIAKLRQEQDTIARQAEQATRAIEKLNPDDKATQEDLARRVADQAKREKQLADKVEKLDTPGHEERQQKTADTLRKAQSDLENGRSQDVAASQQAAKRELERLEQALSNQVPADEQADRLAKKQKELAREMARNAAKPDAKRGTDLQQRQAEMSSDVQRLQAPEAASSKEEALELSRKTESAKSPEEAAKAAEQTADALQKLADQINNRDTDADKADRLAKKQKENAEEADRLARKKENQAELKKKAQQLAEEAKNLRAGADGQKDKQDAIEALNRAQRANDPETLVREEKRAAEALERLAEKMKQQQAKAPPPIKKEPDEKLDGLPTEAQAEEARKLADEQRQIRDDLAKAAEEMAKGNNTPPEKNPLAEIVEEQKKVAKEAADLAREVNKQKGEMAKPSMQAKQSADAANQAVEQLQNGNIEPAKLAGQQAAQNLEQLGQGDLDDLKKKDAHGLAKRQEEINKKLAEMSGDARAAQAQQGDRQKDLQKQVEELNQKMQRLTQQLKQQENAGEAGRKAEEGAIKTEQAAQAMKDARQQNQKGQPGMSRDAQERAAEALSKAGEDLKGAAEQMAQRNGMNPMAQGNQPAGQATQEARDRMSQAQNRLGQGNNKQAGEAMQQAADALKQAGQQIGKQSSAQNGPPQPGNQGGAMSGGNDGTLQPTSDSNPLAPFGEKYKGKSWGELPGEVRTQILQDIQTRYGEDYAKYIKLYFEQLADRK